MHVVRSGNLRVGSIGLEYFEYNLEFEIGTADVLAPTAGRLLTRNSRSDESRLGLERMQGRRSGDCSGSGTDRKEATSQRWTVDRIIYFINSYLVDLLVAISADPSGT